MEVDFGLLLIKNMRNTLENLAVVLRDILMEVFSLWIDFQQMFPCIFSSGIQSLQARKGLKCPLNKRAEDQTEKMLGTQKERIT
jgi:hypothetical protein